jgi:hypothetical protein
MGVDSIEIQELSKYVSPNQTFNPSKTFECKISNVGCCWHPGITFGNGNSERRDTNIQCLLYLLKYRLPYLADIGMTYKEWKTIKSEIAETTGPDSESAKNWDEIWIYLERNRLGMALLHPAAALTVPLGLWPILLAKTTTKMSSSAEGDEDLWDKEDNPLDGLFALVQGLGVGGYLTNRRNAALNDIDQERNKRPRPN